MKKNKIILIGYQRTGTTTVSKALINMGFSVVGTVPSLVDSLAQKDLEPSFEMASEFDVLEDLPWFKMYKELDVKFPNSKFILTLRDVDSWWDSFLNNFGDKPSKMRLWAYGSEMPNGEEKKYKTQFENHYKEVREYFKERPNDILELDVIGGEGYEKLAPFLGVEPPVFSFPHVNKRVEKYTLKDWMIFYLRKITPVFIRRAIVRLRHGKNGDIHS